MDPFSSSLITLSLSDPPVKSFVKQTQSWCPQSSSLLLRFQRYPHWYVHQAPLRNPNTNTTQPSPQSTNGTLGLGEQCTTSSECANGANCYATNSGLIPSCGNFQASCTTDSQCAYNTCNDGLCNGYLSINTTSTSSAAETTPTIVYLPLGAECNPRSTPCANGSECWASNSMLQPRCGNFNAACTDSTQCAYNICNTDTGLCTG